MLPSSEARLTSAQRDSQKLQVPSDCTASHAESIFPQGWVVTSREEPGTSGSMQIESRMDTRSAAGASRIQMGMSFPKPRCSLMSLVPRLHGLGLINDLKESLPLATQQNHLLIIVITREFPFKCTAIKKKLKAFLMKIPSTGKGAIRHLYATGWECKSLKAF